MAYISIGIIWVVAAPRLVEVLYVPAAQTGEPKPAAWASTVNSLELQNHWSYLRPTEAERE